MAGDKWMTSGASRLKSRMNRTFERRASLGLQMASPRTSKTHEPSSTTRQHPGCIRRNTKGREYCIRIIFDFVHGKCSCILISLPVTGTYSQWADPMYRRAVTPSSHAQGPLVVDDGHPPGTILPRRIRDVKAATWREMPASVNSASFHRRDPSRDLDPSAQRQMQAQNAIFREPTHRMAHRYDSRLATGPMMYQPQHTGRYGSEVPYPHHGNNAAHYRDSQFTSQSEWGHREGSVQYSSLPPINHQAGSSKFDHAHETFPAQYATYDENNRGVMSQQGDLGGAIPQFRFANRNAFFEQSTMYDDHNRESGSNGGFVQHATLPQSDFGAEEIHFDRVREAGQQQHSSFYGNHSQNSLIAQSESPGIARFRIPNRRAPSAQRPMLNYNDCIREPGSNGGFVQRQEPLPPSDFGAEPFRLDHLQETLLPQHSFLYENDSHNPLMIQPARSAREMTHSRIPNRNASYEHSAVLPHEEPTLQEKSSYSTNFDAVTNRNFPRYHNVDTNTLNRDYGVPSDQAAFGGPSIGNIVPSRHENFESHDITGKRELGRSRLRSTFFNTNQDFGGDFHECIAAQQLPHGIDRFKSKRQRVDEKKSDSAEQGEQAESTSRSALEKNQDEVLAVSDDSHSSISKRPPLDKDTREDNSVQDIENQCTKKDVKRHQQSTSHDSEQKENTPPPKQGERRAIGAALAFRFFNGDQEVDLSGRPVNSKEIKAENRVLKQPNFSPDPPDPLESMDWKNEESLWG